MKCLNYVITLLVISSLMACGGSKQATSPNEGETEIVLPFKDFRSDASHLRVVGIGVSKDIKIARTIAFHNAQSQFSKSIETLFDEVNSNYFNQYRKDGAGDLSEKFEGMSRTINSTVLKGLVTRDEKIYRNNKTGEVTCYAAVDLSKDQIGQQMSKSLSSLSKDEIDVDEALYRKIFNEDLKTK